MCACRWLFVHKWRCKILFSYCIYLLYFQFLSFYVPPPRWSTPALVTHLPLMILAVSQCRVKLLQSHYFKYHTSLSGAAALLNIEKRPPSAKPVYLFPWFPCSPARLWVFCFHSASFCVLGIFAWICLLFFFRWFTCVWLPGFPVKPELLNFTSCPVSASAFESLICPNPSHQAYVCAVVVQNCW